MQYVQYTSYILLTYSSGVLFYSIHSMIPQRLRPRMHPSHRPSGSCPSDWCSLPEGWALQPPVVAGRHPAGQRLPRGSPVHMGWRHHGVRKATAAAGHDGAAHCREGQRVPHSDKIPPSSGTFMSTLCEVSSLPGSLF